MKVEVSLRYLLRDKDRHGNPRLYYRAPGRPMVRLRSTPGSPEFFEEYQRAQAGPISKPQLRIVRGAPEKSLRWLVEQHYRSARYRTLGESTRRVRRSILDNICESEVDTPSGRMRRGDLPYAEMRAKHVRGVRDEKIGFPEAANSRVKALRQVFTWALNEEHVALDPTAGVELLPGNADGFHTWTVAEVRQYEARWPVGTKQRLALDVLLYTGTRRSDAVRLGPKMEQDGWLHFTEAKNANSRALGRRGKAPRPKQRAIPILHQLRASIDACATGADSYLITAYGRPYKDTSFGNSFREWCNLASLPQCSAHGLRKAGATIASDNGATTHQLMAIYGWETVRQAELYTRAADRVRLAREAMHLVVPR